MSNCFISFHNNPQAVFYGGQLLSGTAVLTTVKQKTIRAIYVQVKGFTKVLWIEAKRCNNRMRYHGSERHFFKKLYLVGRPSDNETSNSLPAGRHTYNFEVELPDTLPSSFLGKNCIIRYEVMFYVAYPLENDSIYIKPISVISMLDLNSNTAYKLPIQKDITRDVFCGWCNSQEIKISCRIPCSGYAPGQRIPITVIVANNSSVDCYSILVTFTQHVSYSSIYPIVSSRENTHIIAERKLDSAFNRRNTDLRTSIQIPALPPSTLLSSGLVDISYLLTIKVQTSGFHRNFKMSFPLIIGAIPIREPEITEAPVIAIQPSANVDDRIGMPPLYETAIHIEILGHAKVRWTERKSRRKADGKTEYYTVTFSAYEQYLSSRTYVVGNDCGNSFEFQPGSYSYNFQVQLPVQLPSSIEGRYGHVRYEVVLTVDRPWRFDNVFKKCFTVIETLNLNLDPIYKQPIYSEDTKTFCCGCCDDEFIKITCRIPFSGYCPGQKVPFTILVENESTVECYDSKIKLEKTVKFTARSPHTKSRYETSKVVEKELGPVLKTSNKEFKDFIQLPSIPPSSFNPGHIIDVYYMATVKVQTSGCHANGELTFPIKIGTIPLIESATNPASVVTIQPTAPHMPGKEGEDAPPPYLGNAPPSYENATAEEEQMTDDEDDKHVKKEPFVPKYPVYYNFAAPSAPPSDQPSASAPLLNREQAALPGTSSNNQPSTILPYPSSDTAMPALPSGAQETKYGWKS